MVSAKPLKALQSETPFSRAEKKGSHSGALSGVSAKPLFIAESGECFFTHLKIWVSLRKRKGFRVYACFT